MVKKSEAESALRTLMRRWARKEGIQKGQAEMPSFEDFHTWLSSEGYSHYMDFRSTMGAWDDTEHWFDEEMGQTWRN